MTKEKIINKLNNNEICILPTDTVYGLMAIMNQENEIAINKMKNSSIDKKISLIFESVDSLISNIDTLSEEKLILIKEKLPGKYTFIVNLNKDFCLSKGFKRTDFGVRVTTNDMLQNIIKSTGPLLATSCNYSGEDICNNLDSIKKFIGNRNISLLYIDESKESSSTIIDLTNETINIVR